ncbi:hypothetical protein [Tuwongella immobilis]|uniref:DUF3352 domain-containing protein n=1 Tax=Tuwongella immobilis TaxID=692036 RepID=A0A6C2YTX3_9BACT|nr:hypothetical protein [Tuwongella immobilis]VIP04936.1 Uncharacterized protein OS=Singulisphaera acidiphila (strain ATCC BAA-1392 / DSM 18658 / VKM B-2454 / MOB10) GN=Sinac_6718 PE=4 SV=1 [Tuwongella immobilis]VTS07230.1 Uncharacterized protein OS=Singulisphaera acidiphila (strain ATCC BAA-1392 / DSM 18658 / VKM B-2454 / MOB10) GN=Sinac_6718 PE=4 SV=1 [Tuwongella immobilis]
MRLHRLFGQFCLIACAISSRAAIAAETPPPLQLVPADADFVVEIPNPRLLAETLLKHPNLKAARELEAAKELLESTNLTRFLQLVSYYERDLGVTWPQLLDQLAGRGMVVAGKYANPDNTALLIGGTDDEQMQRFLALVRKVIESEYSRQESKLVVEESTGNGVTILSLGGQASVIHFDRTLIITGKPVKLEEVEKFRAASLARLVDSKKFKVSRNLKPKSPLAWAWFDLEDTKKSPEAQAILATPRNDPITTFLFAGLFDIYRRSPSLVVGLTEQNAQIKLGIKLPAGREGLSPDTVLHLSHDSKTMNSQPLLTPPGTVFSHSFYLDLAAFWNDREKIFAEGIAKSITEANKPFIPGLSNLTLSKILTSFGPHHRIVVAQVPRSTYATAKPNTELPDSAFVTTIPEASNRQAINAALRAGGLALSTVVKTRYTQEKIGEVTLVGYRFDEKTPLPDDEENLRYNYSPCFAFVGDQLIVASSLDLGRVLIADLQNPKGKPSQKSNMQMGFYAEGIAKLVTRAPESLITQAILSRALTIEEAKKEVEQGIAWLNRLGKIGITTEYLPKSFELSFTWTPRTTPSK